MENHYIMTNKISKENIWHHIGYIEISRARKETLKSIGSEDYKLPSQISKETKLTSSQVSNALKSLKDRKLVTCLKKKKKKGRLYKCTNLGLYVLENIKD